MQFVHSSTSLTHMLPLEAKIEAKGLKAYPGFILSYCKQHNEGDQHRIGLTIQCQAINFGDDLEGTERCGTQHLMAHPCMFAPHRLFDKRSNVISVSLIPKKEQVITFSCVVRCERCAEW